MRALTSILILVLFAVASAAPSKQEESDSVALAHKELKRLVGLNERQQCDRYVCEFWFYESVADPTDFARLSKEEKNELKKFVGERAFFLHRFTPKEKTGLRYEVLVSADGQTVIGAQKRPIQPPQTTTGSSAPDRV